MYAIAQIRSVFLADVAGETAPRPKPRLITALLAHASVGTSIAFIIGSQRRLRFAGLFWPCLAKTQGQAQPLTSRKLGAVVAMPDGTHIPVSDRTRSENRMVNDATLHSAQTKFPKEEYFRKRF